MLLNGFAKRLPPLQDLAASDYSLPESGALGEDFREGMEADERECEFIQTLLIQCSLLGRTARGPSRLGTIQCGAGNDDACR